MGAVATGFATIGAVIALGMLLAQLGLLDRQAQATLSKVAFYVANPALLITVLAGTDVGAVFSGRLVAIVAGVAVSAVVFVVYSRRRLGMGATVIGALSSSYANAGNLGIPIATYVLGDAALVAPLLLLQLLVLQPVALTALDAAETARTTRRSSAQQVALRPFRNPITIGSAVGLALALAEVELPNVVLDPLELIGAMAVPSMLMAYGISLRLDPLPGRGTERDLLGLVFTLKLIVQPLVAYGTARLLGLDAAALLAVTVLSALPTAQNVFIVAARYERGVVLARDAIFVTTLGSVPAITVVSAFLA